MGMQIDHSIWVTLIFFLNYNKLSDLLKLYKEIRTINK